MKTATCSARSIGSSSTQYHFINHAYNDGWGASPVKYLRVCGPDGRNCGRTVASLNTLPVSEREGLTPQFNRCEDYCHQRTDYYTNQPDGPSCGICACWDDEIPREELEFHLHCESLDIGDCSDGRGSFDIRERTLYFAADLLMPSMVISHVRICAAGEAMALSTLRDKLNYAARNYGIDRTRSFDFFVFLYCTALKQEFDDARRVALKWMFYDLECDLEPMGIGRMGTIDLVTGQMVTL